MVDPARIHCYKSSGQTDGPVVYWMQRDQRVGDNWALLYAQEKARETNQPLGVVFCLVPGFLGATIRQYGFMLKGLAGVELRLNKWRIPFFLLRGDPVATLPEFLQHIGAGMLITDFNPLKTVMDWKQKLAETIQIAFHEVDAHNILPCRYLSPKQEYAAFTLRKKVERQPDRFLTDIPPFVPDYIPQLVPDKIPEHSSDHIPHLNPGQILKPNHQQMPFPKFSAFPNAVPIDWGQVKQSLNVDQTVAEVNWLEPGETAAMEALNRFIGERLDGYHHDRNFPDKRGQSELSPYLHFGHLSAQRVAFEVRNSGRTATSVGAFLEELIVRRELADNFCLYTERYDSFDAFQPWARNTLNKHRNDPREFLYSIEQLEHAETHDDLWNTAQREMTVKGKMHGFMRMYWAKKILEWTSSPEEALAIAIYLNDKYELDGRDPNGYAGIAWAIGGTHDRPWGERPVFGMIRYMNYQGCRRKFDVKGYIKEEQGMMRRDLK